MALVVQTVCATCTLDGDTGASTCLCLSGGQEEDVVEVEEYVVPLDTIPPVIKLKTGRDGVPFTTPAGANIVIHTYNLVRHTALFPGVHLLLCVFCYCTIPLRRTNWTLSSSYTHARPHTVDRNNTVSSRCRLAFAPCGGCTRAGEV